MNVYEVTATHTTLADGTQHTNGGTVYVAAHTESDALSVLQRPWGVTHEVLALRVVDTTHDRPRPVILMAYIDAAHEEETA